MSSGICPIPPASSLTKPCGLPVPTSKTWDSHTPKTTLSSECKLSGADPSTSALRWGLSAGRSVLHGLLRPLLREGKRTSGERAGLRGAVPAIQGRPGVGAAGGLGQWLSKPGFWLC